MGVKDLWGEFPMSDDPEVKLRQIVEKRVKKRQDALSDFVAYVVVAVIVWAIWLGLQPPLSGLPASFLSLLHLGLAILTVLVGGAVLWQLHDAYIQPLLDASREREVEREIERIKADMLLEKPKRSLNRLELAEDGELLEIVDDELSQRVR
jgi:hypothetical protein